MRENNTITLPCKCGDEVYKICPVCNPKHKGSCKFCAWSGCFVNGCDVGVGVCGDGSFTEKHLQVVPIKVSKYSIVTICENWGTMYFLSKEEAISAMNEYEKIRCIEDKEKRYTEYFKWFEKRNAHIEF